MTVRRGGLAKSKRVRQAKRGKTPPIAATPIEAEAPWYVSDGSFGPEFGSEASPFETPSDFTTGEDEGVSVDTPFDSGSLSEGPTTPQTTYGTESVTVGGPPGKGKGVGKAKKATGSGRRGEKGGLYKRMARATGTTPGEARGIMKRARRQVRAGNRKAAARRIARALSGGPAAGVKRSSERRAKAAAAGQKISKRIQTRQRAVQSAPTKKGKRK